MTIKFPNKCIKCKKENLKLEEFIYVKSIMTRRFDTISLKIPVCDDCKKELLKYEKVMKYLKSKYSFLCIFFISIFFLFVWSNYNPDTSPIIFTFTIVISIISGSLTLLLFVSHLIFSLRKYDRISNYIEIKADGTILIKDPEYRKDFEEVEASKEDELFHCPKCDTLLLIGMEYCHVCGYKI